MSESDKKNKCQCCGINPSLMKDFRSAGVEESYRFYVCPACANLADKWFWEVYNAETEQELREVLDEVLHYRGQNPIEHWKMSKAETEGFKESKREANKEYRANIGSD